MVSGVAATRLEKLHLMKWLNQNCESSVCVGDLSPISFEARWAQREFAQFAAGTSEFHHEFHVHDSQSLAILVASFQPAAETFPKITCQVTAHMCLDQVLWQWRSRRRHCSVCLPQ